MLVFIHMNKVKTNKQYIIHIASIFDYSFIQAEFDKMLSMAVFCEKMYPT